MDAKDAIALQKQGHEEGLAKARLDFQNARTGAERDSALAMIEEEYKAQIAAAPVTKSETAGHVLDENGKTVFKTDSTESRAVPPRPGTDAEAADREAVRSGRPITAGRLADADNNGTLDDIEKQYLDMTDVEAEEMVKNGDAVKDRMALAVAKALVARRDKIARDLVNPEAAAK